MECPCCQAAEFDGACASCGHPNCEAHGKNKRLAKTHGAKKGREWTPHEKYMLYASGFRDGSGIRGCDKEREGLVPYDRGFLDGQRARREAVSRYCTEIGYKPSILRTMET